MSTPPELQRHDDDDSTNLGETRRRRIRIVAIIALVAMIGVPLLTFLITIGYNAIVFGNPSPWLPFTGWPA